MTVKEFIVAILVALAIGITAGVLLCRNSHKEQAAVVYDITHIADSILAANAHSDTIIIEENGKIIQQQGKIIEKFIAIDSLSYDSAYRLWASEAFRYKPIYD